MGAMLMNMAANMLAQRRDTTRSTRDESADN
jgi:hypothetical protein